MQLSRQDYLAKLNGCWLGKNIGGTLGAPTEWRRQINHFTFYQQELKGEPIPNDDLDLQLVWLCTLEIYGIDIDAHVLADSWLMFVTPHYNEYGTGKANLRRGLLPPLSGSVDNIFKHSCGAFIRSEIWACVAPGLPGVAARYAYEDAIVDHGDGEGTYAAVFIAAMQSAAFVVNDLRTVIDIGLSYIPADCGVAKAVNMTVKLVDDGMEWREVRDEILRHHRGMAFFGMRDFISDEDYEKGFNDGVQGYDVPSNIAIVILGLLVGGDDFDKMICTTVNCGEDTDCTGATAGATWGILHGQAAIPEKWITPIGRKVTTLCVNTSELCVPKTVDELVERTAYVAEQVLLRHKARHWMADGETDLAGLAPRTLMGKNAGADIYNSLTGPRFVFPQFVVRAEYPDGPFVYNSQPTRIRILVDNLGNAHAALMARWYCPEGWSVLPCPEFSAIVPHCGYHQPAEMEFTFTCETIKQASNRFILEITAVNRITKMLIPVVLLQGN